MWQYILKRILLMIPTLFGIMIINFVIIQAAPGGPVEQAIAKIKGHNTDITERYTGSGAKEVMTSTGNDDIYRGAQGLEPHIIERIEKMYGFDKPLWQRFFDMMGNYIKLDFGTSFFHDRGVMDLVWEKLPVSISLGLWTTLLIYLVSIPLGVRKAVKDGSKFDVWTSGLVIFGNAIPGFLFAVLLIILFAGSSFLNIFPSKGLVSYGFEELPWYKQILDYFWHITLPIIAMVIGGFAGLTMLCKNSFLEEIRKTYVMTAFAKGNTEKKVLYGHVFRNAMLIVIAGFPAAFLGIFFTGAMLIEVIFSLDGLGLLGYEAVINRNYPVMFGTLFVFTIIGMLTKLLGDLMLVWIDPRIHFNSN